MALTSPDNLRTPDSGDEYALTVDLGVLADNVQTALDRKAATSVSGGYFTKNTGYTWGTSDTLVTWDNPVQTTPEFTYAAGVFTCQVEGVYAVSAQATIAGSSAPGQIQIAIRDGSNVSLAEGFGSRGQAHIQSLSTSTLRPFNVGSKFSITVISPGLAVPSQAGGQGTWVMLWRVR